VRRLTQLTLAAFLGSISTLSAAADPTGTGEAPLTDDYGNVSAEARDTESDVRERSRPPGPATIGRASSRSSPEGSSTKEYEQARVAETKLRQQVADYQQKMDRWRTCMSQNRQPVVAGDAAPFCTQPIPPDFATEVPGTLVTDAAAAVGGGPQIILTPEQVAYIAFARLHLEPLKPVIGPPPELNRWKMAAVGYPLWLSGGGDHHPPAVWDQVFNLRVRLEAKVKSLDFLMGDGNVVTCEGPGLSWTPAVKPGDRSPVCGYQYEKPSLPDSNYTVTARTHWNVNWTINSQTGVIPMVQASSVELPVGELQVLVR
jgi:hypothetical protein